MSAPCVSSAQSGITMDRSQREEIAAVVYELTAATTFVVAVALVAISPIVESSHLFFVGVASLFGSIGIIKA
jgi:hypothetical protein